MPDLRTILTRFEPDDPDGAAGCPFQARRNPRGYDWEPIGYGATAEAAETNLLELEWDLFNC